MSGHEPEEKAGDEGLLTTGEMARRSNSTLRTVRFYEEAGILHPTRRSESGHRLFLPSDLDRLQLVSELRASGLHLDEIKSLLDLKNAAASGGAAATAATTVLAAKIAELETKLAVLTRLRDDLVKTSAKMADCLGCTDPKFPHHCGDCRVMRGGRDVPRGARVLWCGPAAAEEAPARVEEEDDR